MTDDIFEALVYAYGTECSKGNEYDNRDRIEAARQRVLSAWRGKRTVVEETVTPSERNPFTGF